MRRLHIHSAPHTELRSSRTGEAFSLSAVITEPLGIDSLFVHHDVIPPGRRTSGAHYHTGSDELVLVLSGRVRAWQNGEEQELGEGDVVAFAAGPESPHFIANDGPEPATILVVCSRAADDRVVYTTE